MVMRIIDKSKVLKEVVNTIVSKAKYQKVIFCLDEDSDMELVDDIINNLNKQAVIIKYYYNKHNAKSFYDMANNGARIVVYNIKNELFYKLKTNNSYLLNIFIPQSNFLLPYLSHVESVYGDNLIVANTSNKDFLTIVFLYQLAIDKVWASIIQNQNVDTKIFKNLDAIVNGNVDFYSGLAGQAFLLSTELDVGYTQVDESQLPYYIYLKLCFILKLCEEANGRDLECVDFYKTEKSIKEINKAHDLMVKYKVIDILKLHSNNLIKVTNVILNRIKIIIKKYFNFKNIKLNKLIKIIKNQSKGLNIDNLLYISYIFNTIK